MSGTEETRELLEGLLVEARRVAGCVAGYEYDDFALDETLFEEAAWSVAAVGDVAKRLPAEVKALAPDIDWRELADLRDALTHAREVRDGRPAVSAAVLWSVARDMPSLATAAERLLRRLDAFAG